MPEPEPEAASLQVFTPFTCPHCHGSNLRTVLLRDHGRMVADCCHCHKIVWFDYQELRWIPVGIPAESRRVVFVDLGPDNPPTIVIYQDREAVAEVELTVPRLLQLSVEMLAAASRRLKP